MNETTTPERHDTTRPAPPRIRSGTATHMRALPQGIVLLLGDIISAAVTYGLVNVIMHVIGNPPLASNYAYVWFGIWIILRAQQGLYPGYGRSPQTELRLHTVGTIQAAFAQFAVTYAVHDFDRSRLGLGFLWLLLYFTSLPVRYLLRYVMIGMGTYGRPVSIIGAGRTGTLTVQHLQSNPAYGLRPAALYDDNPALLGTNVLGVPVVGTIQDATSDPRTQHAIITIPGVRAERLREIVNAIHARYPITWSTPDLFGIPNQALIMHSIGAHAALEIRNNLRSVRARFIKRTLDLGAGLAILALIAPVLLLIAVAIRVDSPGPAIYRARRLGRDGRPFACLKFRSMYRDADEKLRALLTAHPELQVEFEATHKLKNDPRVTRVGAFLRRTSLDELPQLLNVLVGDMSLVGPRPIVHAEVSKYGRIYDVYKLVRPGMTGYWQVNGRSDTSYDERVGMDNYYITNWTPWLDIVILIQTVRVVLVGRGAY